MVLIAIVFIVVTVIVPFFSQGTEDVVFDAQEEIVGTWMCSGGSGAIQGQMSFQHNAGNASSGIIGLEDNSGTGYTYRFTEDGFYISSSDSDTGDSGMIYINIEWKDTNHFTLTPTKYIENGTEYTSEIANSYILSFERTSETEQQSSTVTNSTTVELTGMEQNAKEQTEEAVLNMLDYPDTATFDDDFIKVRDYKTEGDVKWYLVYGYVNAMNAINYKLSDFNFQCIVGFYRVTGDLYECQTPELTLIKTTLAQDEAQRMVENQYGCCARLNYEDAEVYVFDCYESSYFDPTTNQMECAGFFDTIAVEKDTWNMYSVLDG